jgi:acetyl esterase
MAEPFVDADTAALLTRMAVDFAGAPAHPTVAERRQGLDVVAELYGPALSPMAQIVDRIVPGPGGGVPVRIYRPIEPAVEKPPILLHIHGGGWVLGGPDAYARVARAYCQASGCMVVDVDYRRAPEHKHPCALEDCLAVLDWAAAEAEALGADGSRLFVTGDSAGGHLAALVCQKAEVALAGQVLVYPVMTASAAADFASRRDLGDGRWFLREFDILRAETEYFAPGDAARETADGSPLLASKAVLAALPPTLVVTAGLDPLRDEGAAYADALRAAGVDVAHDCVPGVIHGYVLFAGEIEAGWASIERIGAWIRGRL